MATVYSGWSDTWKPSGSSVNKQYRARLDYSTSQNATTVYCSATTYFNLNSTVTVETVYGKTSATSGTTYSGTTSTSYGGSTTVTAVGTKSYSWARKESGYYVYVYGSVMSNKKDWDGYWMTATASIWIPALDSYTVSYDKNGGTDGTVNSQTKYYSVPLTLTTEQYSWLDSQGDDAFAFLNWNTANDGSGTTYLSGDTYTSNAGATLYAQWQALNPPTCSNNGLADLNGYSRYTKTFSDIGTTVSNIQIKDDARLPITITLSVGADTVTHTLNSVDETTTDIIYVTPTTSGTKNVRLEIEDSALAKTQYALGTIEVYDPVWTIIPTYSTLSPDVDAFGKTVITVYADKYVGGVAQNDYDVISGDFELTINDDSTWSIDVEVGEAYVKDPTSTTPEAKIKVEYNHTETEEKEYRRAFFSTTRNANFSTGISNTMFIGGCEITNYSSRVWWSKINDPTYFPDTNYIEVGSNDTAVMGLTKVGDYLGVVKQSKTTDTAIFLVYPTSFEDDTTYAVKQLSSGIGAYGKYAFNVLGDETLFLSPKGVMAIVTGEDKDHKIQNRSYFIDGKLLKEEKLSDAYSFVFDGKYFLAVGKSIYVLDGNQRNSWGNDKTNLVYECYYLDNVPANCFVQYNETLMFSNDYGLCKFKSSDDANAFTDAIDIKSKEENVPVKARWSTLVDDDGALNYYKTMQKKGNVVAVLPNSPVRYEPVMITEDEFNADKTKYYYNDGGYVRCTINSVFDENTQYYVKEINHTKVYVRKDNNERVEIERQFNEQTEIPSELFVNKKFKKYKRLQFILENNEAEPFGVDSIIKQFVIGNYAKR